MPTQSMSWMALIQNAILIWGGRLNQERGNFFVKQGFVPFSAHPDTGLDVFDLTQDTLNQINGKVLVPLADWFAFENNAGSSLVNYSRSVETYSIGAVPWVIITLSGSTGVSNGGGGGVIPPVATVKKPKVSISTVNPTATETVGDTGQFMVMLNAPTTKSIRVKYSIAGTAKNGKDYNKIPSSVLIPGGNVSAIIEVLPIDDTLHEGTEKVTLKLLRNSTRGYTVKGTAAATVKIIDND